MIFVAQIKVPHGAFICATNKIFWIHKEKSGHFVMFICVFTKETGF
jgi:hypothetical protein